MPYNVVHIEPNLAVYPISETTPFDTPLTPSTIFPIRELDRIRDVRVTPDLSLAIYAASDALTCIDPVGNMQWELDLPPHALNTPIGLSPDGTVLYWYGAA
jgi:hypothetical protein